MRAFKVLLLLFVLLVPSILAQEAPAAPVTVSFYVMSKCIFASQFVAQFDSNMNANGLYPIINVTVDYIAKVDPSDPSGFSSFHGPTEGLKFHEFLLLHLSY
jgi:hypothetical protein